MSNNELYHYGVLGMRCGVRKSREGKLDGSKRSHQALLRNTTLSPKLRVLEGTARKNDRLVKRGKQPRISSDGLSYLTSKYFNEQLPVMKRVTQMSKGKTAAQTLLFVSAGALSYNENRLILILNKIVLYFNS